MSCPRSPCFTLIKKKIKKKREKLLLYEIDNLFSVLSSRLHYKNFHSQDIFVQTKHVFEKRNFNQNETIVESYII